APPAIEKWAMPWLDGSVQTCHWVLETCCCAAGFQSGLCPIKPVFFRRRPSTVFRGDTEPVGNWVASAANFPASLLPVGVTPTRSKGIATRQFASKNGQKPKPSRWPAYTSSAHRKGQKPSARGGIFFFSLETWPGFTTPVEGETAKLKYFDVPCS